MRLYNRKRTIPVRKILCSKCSIRGSMFLRLQGNVWSTIRRESIKYTTHRFPISISRFTRFEWVCVCVCAWVYYIPFQLQLNEVQPLNVHISKLIGYKLIRSTSTTLVKMVHGLIVDFTEKKLQYNITTERGCSTILAFYIIQFCVRDLYGKWRKCYIALRWIQNVHI